jgi:hypothetical protein
MIIRNNDGTCLLEFSSTEPKKDNELFSKNGVDFKLTEFSKYIIISQAKKYFASKIVLEDKIFKYHAASKIVEVPDPKEVFELLQKNQDKKNAFDEAVSEWKKSHPEYYEVRMSIPNISKYAKGFNSDILIYNADEAVLGYKLANELLKSFNSDPIKTHPSHVIKDEFKELWNKEKELISSKTGWFGESEIVKECKNHIKETKTRLKLSRQPCSSDYPFMKYVETYTKYLAENKF